MALKLEKNPCTAPPGYRKDVVLSLPKLEELDGVEIALDERLLYQGVLGNPVSIKAAEKALEERIANKQKLVEKTKMSEEQKVENVKEFAEISEMQGIVDQTTEMVGKSKLRYEEARDATFQQIDTINQRFIALLKTSNK